MSKILVLGIMNVETTIKKAMIFVAYKIGENGGAEGFISEADIMELASIHIPPHSKR